LEINEVSPKPRDIVDRPFPTLDSGFRDHYLLKEVLRKYPGFDIGVDTREAAISSFLEDERLNAETNERLWKYNVENPRVSRIFSAASRKAVQLLGRFPWDQFVEGARFGPGATTSLSRLKATVVGKLYGKPDCSSSAWNLAHEYVRLAPLWYWNLTDSGRSSDPIFAVQNADKFAVVPKNCSTGRGIGIGPDMNVTLQLGVGAAMRSKLYLAGININDQSINQRLALQASIDGRDATIDVRSASQSVTRTLVWRMLGDHVEGTFDPTWYSIMDTLRVTHCLIDGIPHEYELFSAMGNGYTFELETLVFWALAHATCEDLGIRTDVSVYGDDIILPVEAVPLLEEVFQYCGFRLNKAKSFSTTTGPLFRESCGKHYLDGLDVTPFYVDEVLRTPDQIILLANNIKRWSRFNCYGLDGRLQPLWSWVVSHLHEEIRLCAVPFGEADTGLILDWDEALPAVYREVRKCPLGTGIKHFEGYSMTGLYIESRLVQIPEQQRLVPLLYLKSVRKFSPKKARTLADRIEATTGYPPPEVVKIPVSLKKSIRFKKRHVYHWTNTGPWITGSGEVVDHDLAWWAVRMHTPVTWARIDTRVPHLPRRKRKSRKTF
jgi:hypothetical protein